MLNCSDTESEVDQAPEQTEQLAALSGQVARGDVVCNCESLLGWLHGQPVKLLIDFGSSSSFINQRLVSKGQQVCQLPRKIRVKVAGGGEFPCTHEVPACEWWSQGYPLWCDLKIIPLGSYDIILGMDWLEFIAQ
jgi:hypothetical protein